MMQKIGTIILDIQSCKNYGCVHRMRVLVQLCPRERVSLIKLKDMRINRMYLIIAGNCSASQRITVGALDCFFFFPRILALSRLYSTAAPGRVLR